MKRKQLETDLQSVRAFIKKMREMGFLNKEDKDKVFEISIAETIVHIESLENKLENCIKKNEMLIRLTFDEDTGMVIWSSNDAFGNQRTTKDTPILLVSSFVAIITEWLRNVQSDDS